MNPQGQANPQLLHRFLGIGVSTLAAVFLGLAYLGTAPLLRDGETAPALMYAMVGLSTLMMIVALVFLRPRVPERAPGQSVAAYWGSMENASAALLVWFVLEGAAILAGLAFVLTAHPAAAIAMGVGIIVFWLCGPNLFARP